MRVLVLLCLALAACSSGGPTQPSTHAVTLSWTTPDQFEDGSVLTGLTGYRLVYGAKTQTLPATAQSLKLQMRSGEYTFRIYARTAQAESVSSNPITMRVP